MGQIQEERRIKQQIKEVYEKAPVVRTKVRKGKRFVFQEAYRLTPQQKEEIIELAEQLPPKEAEKYIVEAPPPKEEPKGIAETLVSVKMEDVQRFFSVGIADLFSLKGKKREEYLKKYEEISYWTTPRLVTGEPMPMFGEPVQTIGGVVAPVESLVYGGERLVSALITKHEPVTPRPPPTVTGGIIGTALGKPTELEAAEEYGVSYMMGTLLGDVILGYAIGKGIEKTPLAKPITKLEEKIIGKLPARLKKLFIKTELEVQRRYDPHALYAIKQARYRPHYTLKSDLAKFIQTTAVTTKPVHTPFSATLGKTIQMPTSTGQIILQKTTLETMKKLPTLTLIKTTSPVVHAIAPKVAMKTTQIIIGKSVIHPFVWAGTKLPSLVGVSWTKVTKPKLKPYPVMKAPVKILGITKTSISEQIIPKKVVAPSIVNIITPSITPAVTPKPVQVSEVVVSPMVSQVSIQKALVAQAQIQTKQTLSQQILGKPPVTRKKKRKRRKKRGIAKRKFGLVEYKLPVATASEVAKYVLGKN